MGLDRSCSLGVVVTELVMGVGGRRRRCADSFPLRSPAESYGLFLILIFQKGGQLTLPSKTPPLPGQVESRLKVSQETI